MEPELKYLDKYDAQIAEVDSNNYIVMPADFVNGKYGQGDIRIDPARISDNSNIRKIGKNLGLKLRNDSKDSLGREFVGNINWEQAMKINLSAGKYSPPLNQFADYLNLLDQGAKGEIDVFNKTGKKLDPGYLGEIRDDIIKVQSPWRAEWIDADFKVKNDQLYINSNHTLNESGILVPNSSETLKSGLMDNKTPGINLTDWIKKPTKQGLPRKNINSGDLYYYAPMNDNNSVARFYAYPDWASLSCNRDPSCRDSDIGVRAAEQDKQ